MRETFVKEGGGSRSNKGTGLWDSKGSLSLEREKLLRELRLPYREERGIKDFSKSRRREGEKEGEVQETARTGKLAGLLMPSKGRGRGEKIR